MRRQLAVVPSRKAEQSRETRERLIRVARDLFSTNGYAATSLDEVCARAGMTRGALYHQFRDKRDLFRAVFEVVEAESKQRVLESISPVADPIAQVLAGVRVLLEACADPTVRRIALVEAPAVLGYDEWRKINNEHAYQLIQGAVAANIEAGNLERQPVAPLARFFVGALNEAALDVGESQDPDSVREEFIACFDRLIATLRRGAPRP